MPGLRQRTRELLFLVLVGLPLAGAAWLAAESRIGGTPRTPDGQPPINLSGSASGDLRALLDRSLDEPEITVTIEQISAGHKPAVLGSLRPYWIAREPATARKTWFRSIGLLLAAFLAAHLLFRFSGFQGSSVVLPLMLLLCGIAALILFGLRDPLRDSQLYEPFVHGVAGGCLAMAVVARFMRVSVLAEFRYVTILVALLLSALLVARGSGPAGTDAKINLFGVFQPVEFVKLLVVLFLASYFAERDVELRRLDSFRWMGLSLPRLRDMFPVCVAVAAALALFFLQKDLGPALILYLVFLGLFIAVSMRYALGLAGLGIVVAGFWGAYHFRLLQTVSTRIEMWLSPWDNHRPGGIQLAESLWALASGGTWGRGLGLAEPHQIPAGHTDLILAATGEVLGAPGTILSLAALSLLFVVIMYHAWRARGAYAAYLGFGLALLFGVQTALIAGATVGLLPLTGVPVPFMSYGKSATLAHFLLIGLALNLSSLGAAKEPVRRRVPRVALAIPAVVFAALVAAGARAAYIMGPDADRLLCQGALTPQADGVRRFSYNRRLLVLVSRITRGAIVDRNGVPLAVSDPRRRYPLGPAAVQVLGHTRGYWTSPQTVERFADAALRGYTTLSKVVLVDGNRIVQRDYSALAPAFRSPAKLTELLAQDRTLRLTLDAHLQAAAYRALEANLPIFHGERRTKGAVVALRASTGEILALTSLPSYDPNELETEDLEKIYGAETKAGLDRARFEVYPPGSTFKVVTAAAALESGESLEGIRCSHAGYVEWRYQGGTHRRLVTDDASEAAHGQIGMERALVESCNVYFAWLGARIGAAQLYDMARNRFQLELTGVSKAEDLDPNLPDNAYGQARVNVSPLRMAQVAATVVNGGLRVEPALLPKPSVRARVLGESTAATLRQWMLEVVERGTGRAAAVPGLMVGGKTGTAQTEAGDKVSHSWFIGFAYPIEAGPENAMAFAFVIENGGYGGRAAAGAAHDFLTNAFRSEARMTEAKKAATGEISPSRAR